MPKVNPKSPLRPSKTDLRILRTVRSSRSMDVVCHVEPCWSAGAACKSVGGVGLSQCRYAPQRKLENDNHIFKWVDEAFTDEIQQLDYQVRMLEEEVQVLKETMMSGPKIMKGGCLILDLGVVVVVGILMYK
ncbi:unnamed protein product [Brassica rapa subsp. narinosa]|uniref:(rape) hypothetical protein n=1 Tax=Brassica napus TaxID=3708 RepID=A0A816XZD4_BRANA|nr:unnamed protein product [Brassica napus]